jgi:hypothetical protein
MVDRSFSEIEVGLRRLRSADTKADMEQPRFDMRSVDATPFATLVGQEVIDLIIEHAPRKVLTRVARALDHLVRAPHAAS